MKRSKVFSLLSSALMVGIFVVLSAGCSSSSNRNTSYEREGRYGGGGGRYGYQGDYASDVAIVEETETVTETVTQDPPPQTTAQTQPSHNVVTAAAPQTPVKRSSVYGTKVPGKPGYVYSPYDPRLVDVRGHAPGTEVRCPYTNKIFLVP